MGMGYSVALVGATGAVGQTMVKVLEERKFPVRNLRLLASERSEGKSFKFLDEEVKVEKLTEDSFNGIDIALFSAGASRSKEFVPFATRVGAVVIDNSSAFRMEPDVPLIVPEVNPHAIAQFEKRGIISNPNCTTIVMVVPLKPLHDYGRVRRVIASSYQAVSGAGGSAIRELEEQVRAYVHGRPLEVMVFPYQIAFNLFPHIDAFLENGYTKEEMKLHHETRKILEDEELRVTATTVRVPVFYAHSVAVSIETDQKISREKARELLSQAPGVRLYDEPAEKKYPMPVMVAGQDECFVGRIREDISHEKGLCLWIVGDQLRKGAATNAIQIAEILVEKYL